MKVENVHHREIRLLGLSVRTNNYNELNVQSKIGELVGVYFGQNIANTIPNRVYPGVTIAGYTQYDSDEHGDYTYIIGEEVSTFDNAPSSLSQIIIPAGYFQKFTTMPGKMPNIVIDAWQRIWKMSKEELGGERKYLTDFEVYDQRAVDPNHSVVDIYIGIK